MSYKNQQRGKTLSEVMEMKQDNTIELIILTAILINVVGFGTMILIALFG